MFDMRKAVAPPFQRRPIDEYIRSYTETGAEHSRSLRVPSRMNEYIVRFVRFVGGLVIDPFYSYRWRIQYFAR